MSEKKVKMKWGGGQLFCFSALDGLTDFARGLVLRSADNDFVLEIKLPESAGSITFPGEKPEYLDFAGDYLDLPGLRCAFLDAHHWLIEGVCSVNLSGDSIKTVSSGNRTLIGVSEFFNPAYLNANIEEAIAARRKWLDALCLTDPVLRKACSQLKTQLLSPEGCIHHIWSTPDRFPHRGMWIWDSAFHAVGLNAIEPKLAKEILLAVFDNQREDGFIPHQASPVWHSEITQPPVLGYAAEKLLETEFDSAFLSEFYRENGAFLQWIMANRDSDGLGLVEWFIEGNPHCRCGESGMDNSSRFDGAIQLDAPDFNAFLSNDCRIMAKFAVLLGLTAESAKWQQQSERLNQLMNQMLWNSEYGLYFDRDVRTGKLTNAASSAGFLPLLCSAASPEQAEAMVKNMHDPKRFAAKVPIPSISKDNPDFSTDMWRGPMWTNINLMIAEALEKYGYKTERNELIDITNQTVRKYVEKYGCFFEFFDADDNLPPPKLMRKGPNSETYEHQPLRDYGWSATLYIEQCFKITRN